MDERLDKIKAQMEASRRSLRPPYITSDDADWLIAEVEELRHARRYTQTGKERAASRLERAYEREQATQAKVEQLREWLANCQASEFHGMHQRMVSIHARFDAEQIVRKLAEREPPQGGCDFCAATGEDLYWWRRYDATYIPDPNGHEPDCLWRLAREWVAAHPAE
ncbi:MAG TPA: hypothetical protein VIV12_11355 [Streptosporangiaceae bacterium]